jgi:hypothetical protein
MMTTPTTPTPGLIAWLSGSRAASGVALMLGGIAALAVPVTLVAKYGTEFLPAVILTSALGLLWLIAGVWQRARTPSPGREADEARYLVLAVGGLTGLLTALLGAALAYQWWDYLVDWLRLGKREEAWRVLLALAVLLAGLAVMFLSLQTVRTEERSSAGLRRLLYGYNAVLTGLLLLIILTVANVLVALKFTGVIDATQSGQYTLSDRTINLLKGLDHPVRMYVIWPSDDEALDYIRTLLSNFQDRSPEVKVEYVSPIHDRMKLSELNKTYPRKIEEPYGILVVNGEEKPENATFLKANDLFADEGFGPAATTKFRGEDKIVAALAGAGGTGKIIVYFTQGAGEPDLNDSSPRSDKGLGVLRDRLTARGTFDVRPLRLNPADPKVPDDAAIVVVADPKAPVEASYQKALRQYLVDRRGKAVFLFGVPADTANLKTLPPTGLEGLLGEFNVEVTNSRILSENIQMIGGNQGVVSSPELARVEIAEEARRGQNELARAFGTEYFPFPFARVVRPLNPPPNPSVRAEVLLATRPQAAVWAESDLSADPYQVIQQINRDEAERKKRLAPAPLSAAVTVTDAAPPPGIPGHPPTAAKPRLAVFGDTLFLTNVLTNDRSGYQTFALFASTLDWLSERPTSIGIESRSLPVYVPDPDANRTRMIWLPLLIAVVAVVGLGAGVWVVRRR